jgi:hypothetical protein
LNMNFFPSREKNVWKLRVDYTPSGVRRDTYTIQKMKEPVVGCMYRQYSLIRLSFAADDL